MGTQRIMILEDEPEERDKLQHALMQFGYEVVGVTGNADTAYELYKTHKPDICLVDIYLQGKPDGVAFVQQVTGLSEKVVILFLTSSYDNITFYLAKTTHPHGYLLKPYNVLELQYAIELAVERMRNLPVREQDILFIKRGNSMFRVNIHDIRYIEVDGKYSRIISATEKFLVQQPLKELQSQLPSTLFSRIHRNYLVNIKEVVRIDTASNEVLFKDGNSLFFSRRYLDDLLRFFKVLK